MKKVVKSALIASTLIAAGVSLAQDGTTGRDSMHAGMGTRGMDAAGVHRQPVDIGKLLNLDRARADAVSAILAAERKERQALWEARKDAGHDDASKQAFRDQLTALRESTRVQLTAVLSAEELQTLRAATAANAPERHRQPNEAHGQQGPG